MLPYNHPSAHRRFGSRDGPPGSNQERCRGNRVNDVYVDGVRLSNERSLCRMWHLRTDLRPPTDDLSADSRRRSATAGATATTAARAGGTAGRHAPRHPTRPSTPAGERDRRQELDRVGMSVGAQGGIGRLRHRTVDLEGAAARATTELVPGHADKTKALAPLIADSADLSPSG